MGHMHSTVLLGKYWIMLKYVFYYFLFLVSIMTKMPNAVVPNCKHSQKYENEVQNKVMLISKPDDTSCATKVK